MPPTIASKLDALKTASTALSNLTHGDETLEGLHHPVIGETLPGEDATGLQRAILTAIHDGWSSIRLGARVAQGVDQAVRDLRAGAEELRAVPHALEAARPEVV